MSSFLDDKVILVTGGTGSFGHKFIETVLAKHKPKKIIVFSRDEWKQSQMQENFNDQRLRFFLGDVRDAKRVHRAFHGADIVVHAAALKQVPMLEYNPFEAVQTNIMGAENIINAAIDTGVKKVVALSTDKAVNPVNLYGATKLCAEKLFVDGNAYSGDDNVRFSIVRYGNVVGSRGSVIPLFAKLRSSGALPITDERMTRFWITLDHGVQLVMDAIEKMQGGEIFVPKIPSMRLADLAKAMAPDCKIKIVGVRPGEKIHEVLITEDESARTIDVGPFFVVRPQFTSWKEGHWKSQRTLPVNFRYSSDNNDVWLKSAELTPMLEQMGIESPVNA